MLVTWNKWLEHIMQNCSVATYKLYSGTLTRHVSPFVLPETIRLNQITVQHIDALVRSLTPGESDIVNFLSPRAYPRIPAEQYCR